MPNIHTAIVSICCWSVRTEHTLVPHASEIHVAAILEMILAIKSDLSAMMEGWDVIEVFQHGDGFFSIEKPSSGDFGDSDVAQELNVELGDRDVVRGTEGVADCDDVLP